MNKNDEQKVGPQGTQVFDLTEVESMLAKELREQSSQPGGKPALVGISKPFTGKSFSLTQTKYQIGRKNSSDITLDEPSVSSTHAQIIFSDGQWKVLNLLSSNGTYVNGDKVSESDIFPGDQIRFGGVEFMFCTLDDNSKKANKGMSTFTKVLLWGVIAIAVAGAAAYFTLMQS